MLHDHKHLCVAAAASVSIVVRCIVNCFFVRFAAIILPNEGNGKK